MFQSKFKIVLRFCLILVIVGLVMNHVQSGFSASSIKNQGSAVAFNSFFKKDIKVVHKTLLSSKKNNQSRNLNYHKPNWVSSFLKRQCIKIQQKNCATLLIYSVETHKKVSKTVNSYLYLFISSVFRPPSFSI